MTAPVATSPHYDEHNVAPGSQLGAQGEKLKRAEARYVNKDDQFRIKKRDYERQFSQMYFYRLVKLRPLVVEAAQRAWPGVKHVRILDVPEQTEVFIVGTLYKEMALKPRILDEYTKDVVSHTGGSNFTQPSDVAVLEDEGGRVSLVGDHIDVGKCVTGVIAAVKGTVLESGDFQVSDMCYAGMAPQEPVPDSTQDAYVALMSGFSLGGDAPNNILKIQMMLDYCSGVLGAEPEQKLAAKIVRVVFAGGILKGTAANLSQPTSYASVKEQTTALEPIHDADALFAELCETVDVDIMPGVADPANYSLPQQPLHRCLLPQTSSLSTVTRCTNPHSFEVDGVSFLGTSGQNIDDVRRYSTIDGAANIMEKMLQWRHIIPTAPDSLASYPYSDEDPFILESTPRVLFAGGQPTYETKLVTASDGQCTRIISIPDFSLDSTMILVNVRTLDVHPIRFDVSIM